MQLAPMFAQLVALERRVSDAAKAADPKNEMRVYPWRPTKPPELPAIWNWIDDGSYEVDDTARATDALIIVATIGVKPANVLAESMDRLVVLTDHFREVVDPALWTNQPLPAPDANGVLRGTAKRAKRVVTRTNIDEFDGIPVMCMDMLIRVELPQIIGG